MWRSSSTSENLCHPKSIEQVWNDITVTPHLHRASTPRVVLQDFFSKEPPPAAVSRPPPPPTLFTLNSAHDHFGTLLLNPYHQTLSPQFDALIAADVAGGARKRFSDSDRYPGDCRNKRMMKNRVSAARSRARKQAYTNELEIQVAHLRRQNATLRKQQEELHIAAASGGELQEKKLLHRTSSAPF